MVVKTRKMPKTKICCMQLRIACALAGAMHLILTILTLIFYIYVVMIKFSRGSLLNIGFNIIIILPALPFFVGMFVQFRELLIPYMIGVMFSIGNNLTWVLIAIFVELDYLDAEQDVFKLEYVNCWTYVGLFIAVTSIYVYVLATIGAYFRYVRYLNTVTPSNLSEKKYYPYTRYELFLA